MTPTLDKLVQEFQNLSDIVEKQRIARTRIEMSDEYVELNKAEDNIKNQKLLLMEHLPDSSKELSFLKEQLMFLMEQEGKEKVGPFQGKFREKKEVNTEKVLTVLGGDIDHFLRLAKITQKDLDAIARAEGGERGDALKECVEVVERKMVDLVTPEVR